jgi:hypothetical protein
MKEKITKEQALKLLENGIGDIDKLRFILKNTGNKEFKEMKKKISS